MANLRNKTLQRYFLEKVQLIWVFFCLVLISVSKRLFIWNVAKTMTSMVPPLCIVDIKYAYFMSRNRVWHLNSKLANVRSSDLQDTFADTCATHLSSLMMCSYTMKLYAHAEQHMGFIVKLTGKHYSAITFFSPSLPVFC